MSDARQDRFAGVGQDRVEVIERKRTRRFPRLVLARSKGEGDPCVRPRPRRELGRLVTCNYRLDNRRCQERQPRQSSDVAVCDPFAFSDLCN
jgi:hypothetical protein